MLEVVDVTKTYHGILGVRGLSFTATPGRVIGLLGPNGSGKSTTVRMLVGLLRPSAGIIRWNGADIQPGLRDYQRLVGYVPEEPRLYSYLTAIEYLELVGGLHDIAPRVLCRRISEYLDALRPRHRSLPAAVGVLEGHAAEGADVGGAAARPADRRLRRGLLGPGRRVHPDPPPHGRGAGRAREDHRLQLPRDGPRGEGVRRRA